MIWALAWSTQSGQTNELMLTGWQNVLCTAFIVWPKCPITKHSYHRRLSFHFLIALRGNAPLLYTRAVVQDLQSNLLLWCAVLFDSNVGNFPTTPSEHIKRTLLLSQTSDATWAFASAITLILHIVMHTLFFIAKELSLTTSINLALHWISWLPIFLDGKFKWLIIFNFYFCCCEEKMK